MLSYGSAKRADAVEDRIWFKLDKKNQTVEGEVDGKWAVTLAVCALTAVVCLRYSGIPIGQATQAVLKRIG